MLRLYREALRVRRSEAAFAGTPLTWREAPEGVLIFDRATGSAEGGAGQGADGPDASGADASEAGATVRCVANLSTASVPLPPHAGILLASGPLDDGLLPPDTTAWLRATK
jgi:alpha-glucosidase